MRLLLFAFCGAAACIAQVKLNTLATPSTGYAGVTVENLTGSGFPAGSIRPENVTVSLAASCDGVAIVDATPTTVTAIVGTTHKISFALPATAKAGKYQLSVKGQTSSGSKFTTTSCSTVTVEAQQSFVKVSNGELMLNGQPFRFGGGNSYELMYSSHSVVDQVLQTAVGNQLKVVRTWGWIDIGELNGTGSIRGPSNGYYFHYWTGSAPAFNDGANGLENLDYEIYRAGQLGLKLIIPFTNNWTDFGGMDQYVEWANGKYHDQFYTDPQIRGWYEEWISHLLNRVNTFSGVAYKNDPTILAWELANEPRCTGSGTSGGGYPTSNSCTTATIKSWVANAAAYVKSIDANHLLSVGDEGFFCEPNTGSWIENCSEGVDSIAFAKTAGIDLMGFHLYPEGWGQSEQWSEQYIVQHLQAGKALGKPAYLGEFGLLSGDTRNPTYAEWTDLILKGQGAGALFWDLAVGSPGAAFAEANNSFDLHDGAQLLGTMRNYAQEMAANTQLVFPPVADDQWATTPFGENVTLNPAQNSVPYGGASIEPSTIDLDPSKPGQQTSVHVYGGQYTLNGSNVEFMPDSGFNGNSLAPFTIQDSNYDRSNVAYLNVTVNPSQSSAYILESFETGTDGWGPLSGGGGTVAQSTMFPTNGTHSLQVNVKSSGWFGVSFASPVNLSGRPSLSIDVQSTSIGGGAAIAFQSGSAYTWCQTPDPWPTLSTNSLTTLTVQLDATKLNCSGATPDLTSIETLFVYLEAPGTFYLDNLRAAAPSVAGQTIKIDSFEAGTDGWGALNGNGTASTTTSFHTDGSQSLQIVATGTGDWFGRNLPSVLDLTGTTGISFDVDAVGGGTSVNVAIQSGSGWTWCQGNSWPYETSNNSTVTVPYAEMSCTPDLTQIHAIWIFFNAGTNDLDNVRAQ